VPLTAATTAAITVADTAVEEVLDTAVEVPDTAVEVPDMAVEVPDTAVAVPVEDTAVAAEAAEDTQLADTREDMVEEVWVQTWVGTAEAAPATEGADALLPESRSRYKPRR
jgi:hypothetical protein